MIVQRTTTYAVCPACGADAGSIDHLLGKDMQTWWYCDSCGQRYQLAFKSDGTVDITLARGRKITTMDVMVLKPQPKPVYFVVEGMRFEGERDDDDRDENESKQFLYEEHSCPINWLRPVLMSYDGDHDPHGVIEYVCYRDESELPPDENWGPNDRDMALISIIEDCDSKAKAQS